MATKTKQKLNVRLLRRIQKHILKEPRRFFMGWFFAIAEGKNWQRNLFTDFVHDLSKQIPPCGTAACIAGWANILTGTTVSESASPERAARELGLETKNEDYVYLFSDKRWPQPFNEKYSKAKTPRQRAKIACARIDHLIKTGE